MGFILSLNTRSLLLSYGKFMIPFLSFSRQLQFSDKKKSNSIATILECMAQFANNDDAIKVYGIILRAVSFHRCRLFLIFLVQRLKNWLLDFLFILFSSLHLPHTLSSRLVRPVFQFLSRSLHHFFSRSPLKMTEEILSTIFRCHTKKDPQIFNRTTDVDFLSYYSSPFCSRKSNVAELSRPRAMNSSSHRKWTRACVTREPLKNDGPVVLGDISRLRAPFRSLQRLSRSNVSLQLSSSKNFTQLEVQALSLLNYILYLQKDKKYSIIPLLTIRNLYLFHSLLYISLSPWIGKYAGLGNYFSLSCEST